MCASCETIVRTAAYQKPALGKSVPAQKCSDCGASVYLVMASDKVRAGVRHEGGNTSFVNVRL